jgi:NADPH:quinone reductase-like Zn-dependent oxidoreductase
MPSRCAAAEPSTAAGSRAVAAFSHAPRAIDVPTARGRKVAFAYPRLDQATVRHFGQLMASGQFTPVIDRHYRLDQIVDAYRYVETGQKIGNVVIIVDPSR